MMIFLQTVICIWEIVIPFYLGHKLCGKRRQGLTERIFWSIFWGLSIGLLIYQRYGTMYSRWYLILEILFSAVLFAWRFDIRWRDALMYLAILYESIYVLDMFLYILIVYVHGFQYIRQMQVTIMPDRLIVFLTSRGLMAGALYGVWRNRKGLREICAGNRKALWIIPVIQHFSLWSCDIVFTRPGDGIAPKSLFLFVMIYMCFSFFLIVFFIVRRSQFEREAAEEKAKMAEQSYQNIICSSRQRDILIHDIRNHLIALEGVIRKGDSDRAICYIEEMRNTCLRVKENPVTSNVVVDTLLGEKMSRAGENGISMKIMSDNLADSFVSDRDWCSILANLLDNAIEACLQLKEGKIVVRLENTSLGMIIHVENSFTGMAKEINGNLISTKKDAASHGIGLQSVRYAMEKYEGVLTYEYENNVFRVNVVLYR